MSAFLTATERATFYPRQIFDESGLCVCANCLDCDSSLFRGMKKPRQCVVCECYNLREIKKFDKQIHCLDCYNEAVNAKRRKQRKAKKEEKPTALRPCREGCGSWLLTDDAVPLCDMCKEEEAEEDFATKWNKEMTPEERVALLSETFDNKEDGLECETCEAKNVKCLIEYFGLMGERWNICEDCEIKFDEERVQMQKCTNCKDILREECGIYHFSRDTEEMTLCDNCGGDWFNGIWEKDGWVRENCRCGDCNQCAKIKPCSCGCGYLGGSCEKGLAIDNGEEEEEDKHIVSISAEQQAKDDATANIYAVDNGEEEEEITIDTLAKYITHEPNEDYETGEEDMFCAQFCWNYDNEKIDNLASEEFTYSLKDGKKNLMWIEKLKQIADWKEGEYIYAYTKTNADGYYNVFYKKDKKRFTWFNTIVERNGYVAMEAFNHYTMVSDADIKTKMFIRVESIYNDKISDSRK